MPETARRTPLSEFAGAREGRWTKPASDSDRAAGVSARWAEVEPLRMLGETPEVRVKFGYRRGRAEIIEDSVTVEGARRVRAALRLENKGYRPPRHDRAAGRPAAKGGAA